MKRLFTVAAIAAMGSGVQAQPEPKNPPPVLRMPRQPGTPDRDQRPRGDEGPRTHEIHFLTSEDGLTFEEAAEPVMRQASVPDIIELAKDLPKGEGAGAKKGSLCIYTVDARDGMREGLSRLVSTDGGKTWGKPERLNVVWGGEGAGQRGAVDPSIAQLPDGKLRMYFYSMERPAGRVPRDPRGPGELPPLQPLAPEPGTDPNAHPPPQPVRPDRPEPGMPVPEERRGPDRSKHSIYSAVSDDGLRFTVEEGVRVEEEQITDPEVVKAGDEWLMFLSRGQEVLLATSDDGLAWKKDKAFILRGGGVPGALVLSDGRVRVYQSSPEGITSVVYDPRTGMFKPDAGVRVKGPCADPAVWPRTGGGFVGVVKRFMKRPD